MTVNVTPSIVSNSWRPCGLWPARLICQWNSPGEWVAISFSRGSSWPRDQTRVSRIAGRFLIIWVTSKQPTCFWNCDFLFCPNLKHPEQTICLPVTPGQALGHPGTCRSTHRRTPPHSAGPARLSPRSSPTARARRAASGCAASGGTAPRGRHGAGAHLQVRSHKGSPPAQTGLPRKPEVEWRRWEE